MENILHGRGPRDCAGNVGGSDHGSMRPQATRRVLNVAAGTEGHVQDLHRRSEVRHSCVGATGPPIRRETGSASKRQRKERDPNWLPQEITALIQAKREMFLQELDTVDERELMIPEAGKWQLISTEVMKAGFSPCLRDGVACKSKWNQVIPEYKRIADYFARSGTNGIDYWNLSTDERKAEGLPRSFPRHVYFSINDWYGDRPSMVPPHSRDLLSADDSNYYAPTGQSEDVGDESNNKNASEDPTEPPPNLNASIQHEPQQPSPCSTSGIRKKGCIPPGVAPILLSSSDNAGTSAARKPGNTGVRRKTASGHSLIAEATKATGLVMAGQMQQMADATRESEKTKIDIQLRLFAEQMEYQRERDRRLHENSTLSIQKQGELVQCLAALSGILSAGLERRRPQDFEGAGRSDGSVRPAGNAAEASPP